MRFTKEFIEQVRDANDILGVIGEYVQLSRAGSSYRGLCPLPGHIEKTPSFFVNDVKQVYNCFGCQKGGDVFKFLQEFRGMDFTETVEFLADRARIALPKPDPKYYQREKQQRESEDHRKVLFKLNQYVAAHFHQNLLRLPADHAVNKYIEKRGIQKEVIDVFNMGYSTSGWSDLVDFLKRGKAPLDVAETLGLLKKKASSVYFDLFRDRLMFPIMTTQGHVIGFGGRSLSDEQQPKYLNSPETPVFSKGRNLYGLHATAKYIRSEDVAFVVEGYMDCIALYSYGFKNVVATLGTAFTPHHASLLKRLCSQVIVLFDGDDAGIAASDKSLPVFLEAGIKAKCLILPDEMDPDDFLKEKGAAAFGQLVKSAPDHFLNFMTRKFKAYQGQPSDKIQILEAVKGPLSKTSDARLRELYIRELADRLNVDRSWILKSLDPARAEVPAITKQLPKGPDDIPKEEYLILELILQRQENLKIVAEGQIWTLFESPEVRSLVSLIIEKHWQNPNDFDKLTTYLIGEEINQNLLTKAAMGTSTLIQDRAKETQLLHDCIKRVRDRHLKKEQKKVIRALKDEVNHVNVETLEVFMKIAKETKGTGEIDR